MSISRAYEEVVDFVAAGTSPSQVIDFHPSPAAKARVSELVERERALGLSSAEKSELDTYTQLEHIMRLAKARARQHLAHE